MAVIQAVVTWLAFSNLGEDAWYPYPDLAIGAWATPCARRM